MGGERNSFVGTTKEPCYLLNEKSDEVKVLNEKVVNQSFIITTRYRMVADFQEKITSAEARNMDVDERNENYKERTSKWNEGIKRKQNRNVESNS